MVRELQLLDSITDADDTSAGRVVLCGSHGGLYPATLASRGGIRAVLFNDAGIGLERAGVQGVLRLADVGMAAAAVDCLSCHIGSASDALGRGIVSVVNREAQTLGLRLGMSVAEAVALLEQAPMPRRELPPFGESRQVLTPSERAEPVILLDSASMIAPGDIGRIVVTGSHGGLVGGDPRRAAKADVRIAVFNDAGFGRDDVGAARLPALDRRAIAAVTVACASARIGDARSAWDSGIISRANQTALALGARAGQPLRQWLTTQAGNQKG